MIPKVASHELVWEEIHGFTSPGEYAGFLNYIEGQVSAGHADEVEVSGDVLELSNFWVPECRKHRTARVYESIRLASELSYVNLVSANGDVDERSRRRSREPGQRET